MIQKGQRLFEPYTLCVGQVKPPPLLFEMEDGPERPAVTIVWRESEGRNFQRREIPTQAFSSFVIPVKTGIYEMSATRR